MFGGGGMNPRKMKQMMKQMGIDVEELDAERVVIETADGDDLVSRRRPGDQDGRSGSGDLPTRSSGRPKPSPTPVPAGAPRRSRAGTGRSTRRNATRA